METIINLKNKIDQLISQQPLDNSEILNALVLLEKEIQPLEDEDLILFGYFKYFIAKLYLTHNVLLNNNQKQKYNKHLKNYKKDFDQYTQKDNIEIQVDKSLELKIIKERLKNKRLLILGYTGVGKSSFVQKLTNDERVEISHQKNSHTQVCNQFENKDGLKFIDSPGINDTKKDRSEILLIIAEYLHKNEIRFEEVFVISLQNDKVQVSRKVIQELAYTYFLYEIFQGQINHQEVNQFIEEYHQSNELLNWFQRNYHQLKDKFFEKRNKIFQNKDLALNYIQLINSFHIVVQTFFDMESQEELEEIDQHKIEYLKEQIWSNKQEDFKIFRGYKKYIEDQEYHLFKKIDKIIELEERNLTFSKGQQIQNILLIGKSQVGKSSLIEQLTNIKGIRGSGKQSETSICQFYSIDFENITYRFIDTPGFDGTEKNQTQIHNLKVIADFLRRNKIIEFRILFMRNPDLDTRDVAGKILQQLFVWIQSMFDRDISFIDEEYLNSKINKKTDQENKEMRINDCEEFQIGFVRDKVLKINRKRAQADEYNYEEIFKDTYGVKNIYFQSNYFTSKMKLVQVNQEVDQIQKKNLFSAINQIEYISIDEKIICQIEQINKIQIIENSNHYMEAFINVSQKYLELYSLQREFMSSENQNNNNNNLQELNVRKLQIIQELEEQYYVIIGDFHKTEQIRQFLSCLIHRQSASHVQNNSFQLQPNDQEMLNNKIQNDIQKHFIPLKFDPVLFESKPNSKYSIFSRKQHYFCSQSHQLKKFIQEGNVNHQNMIEDLAEMKIKYEIAYLLHIQSKYFDKLYDQKSNDVIDYIEAFIYGLNMFIGTGIQVARYASFFSRLADGTLTAAQYLRFTNIAKNLNVVALWANCILAAASIGVDIYSFYKGQICGKQLTLNTGFNIIVAALSITAISVPGLGWIVGGAAAGISLIGYGISAIFFTSSQTFDRTISTVFKNMIDDIKLNQKLLYFQRSQLLMEKFKIKNYTELSKTEGYDMFRILEKKNYKKCEKQQKILLKLFDTQNKNKLRDLISHHIVKTYISNKIQVNLQPSNDEESLKYLERISKYLKDNHLLIDTFYNRFKEIDLEKIKKSHDQVENIVKQLKSSTKNQQTQINDNILNDQQKEVVRQYESNVTDFQDHIVKNEYPYLQQKKFGNGYWRKNDRFPILFNSYCNLMEIKTEKIYSQPIISDLSKDQHSYCFKVKSGKNISDLFKLEEKQKTIDQLTLLYMSEKYIPNRYLQKIEGQDKPNLTCLHKSEVLDCKLEYSFDLHEIANESRDLNSFVDQIKQECREFQVYGDNFLRLQNFYESFIYFKKQFSNQ